MTVWTLIWRSLRFHARAHAGVVFGAAVGTAALTGALVVGDSVRGTLRQKALERIGRIEFAMAPEGRLFRAALADDCQKRYPTTGKTGAVFAAALQLQGTAANPAGTARANKVNVIGVSSGFDQFAETNIYDAIPGEGVLLNQNLATQLGARPGDTVLLRVSRPSAVSREAPIAPRSDTSAALRLRVTGIAPARVLGNFSLLARQSEPLNAFVSLRTLHERIGVSSERDAGGAAFTRANLLLATLQPSDFHSLWQLADLELQIRFLPETSELELLSKRVFLDPPVATAALAFAPDPGEKLGTGAGILTYLANLLRSGTNSTPYSLVTAAGPPYVPAGMRDDEIVVNQWLADDLRVKPGEYLDLLYFEPESGARLVESTNRFRVRAVVPMQLPWADRMLMPEFPGLEQAESTRDWDAGFPLTNPIRAKDEEYWKQYRGTPKAFITLAAGQKMWANRFGNLTAIRYQAPANPAASEPLRDGLAKKILGLVNLAELGLQLEPVRARALAGADQAQDFGQLFLGFSVFVVAAALLLMALLFKFGLEARTAEVGTLLALGFQARQVRRMLLGEGAALALIGGAIGALGGLAYAGALLWCLTHIWANATGGATLQLHLKLLTLVIGTAAGVGVGIVTIWLTARKQARQSARELLSVSSEVLCARRVYWFKRIGFLALLCALVLTASMLRSGQGENAGAFFGAGALLLIAGLLWVWGLLSASAGSNETFRFDLQRLAIAGCARRPWRSAATVMLLACGCFIIAATSAFRLEAGRDASQRRSGTGGFALIGESALPILPDLNTKSGQEHFGLNASELEGVILVPIRVRDGDDASCLNLNRAQQPRLLGVNPALLAGRFTFSAAARAAGRQGWQLLRAESVLAAGEVPAIGDANSIAWALGKKVGDTIDYTDERGRIFKLRLVGALANSILQGNLLIDEHEFVNRFPSESGDQMFLVDTKPEQEAVVSALLSRALQDQGMELTSAVRRLNEFNAVQNTYLGTFQVLGGLGLLLGSAGLGVVVLRNVLERRAELALLLAVGFPATRVRRLVLWEHAVLLALGLGIGLTAAMLAVLPALLARSTGLPYTSLALTLTAVVLNGLFWAWLATRYSLQQRLLSALRNE